jgi:3-hydroxyisobutyrate dehydrogenase-like beta-hydroxyacid dehydrogenase
MEPLKITCIGLGNMGAPIARNLIKGGFNVTVYNRSAIKVESFKPLNATLAASSKQAVEHADVLVTMLSDDAALKDVVEEVIPAMKKGSIHMSMSTVSPAMVDSLLPLHDKYSVQYIASPVMGRPPAAEAKMLSLLISGDKESKQKLKTVFDAIGQRTFDFGDKPSIAHVTKLALNLMILTNVELLSEVMLFAESQGMDKNMLFETISNTAVNSPAIKLYGDLLLKEQDNPNGFATQLAYKDISLAKQTAAASGLQLPLANLISSHFESTIAEGNGDKDVTMLIKHLRGKLFSDQ